MNEDDEIHDGQEGAPKRGKPMGFFDHLEELRWTLVKSGGAFLLFAVLIGIFLEEFNKILLWPLNRVAASHPGLTLDLNSVGVMEPFNVIVQMCIGGGIVLAAPFILFFVGQFVAPALNEREIKLVLPMAISGMGLFLAGAVFCYFILVPSSLAISAELNEFLEWTVRWTPASYYGFVVWFVFGVGAAFEFPLLIVVLVWLGVMSTAFLRKYRRHAAVVIFILAAIITPTTDPLNMSLFAAPLYILYEVAIIIGARVERKREQAAIAM